MRIAILHNRYREPGGEDAVVAAEVQLLRSRGHKVAEITVSNAEVLERGLVHTLRTLQRSAWNTDAYRRAREAIRRHRPDVVHVHNFWFSLSPSVFGAAAAESVPTVMTLHNYRLICPGALLMRGGEICERCIGVSPWRAVPRACYRNSVAQTALVACMIDSNRRRGTWDRLVDAYIALTEFSRRKFIQGGLPAEKIYIKPNCLSEDPGPAGSSGDGAVFVGRLSREKGVHVLLNSWKSESTNLTVVGDGPERSALEAYAARLENVEFCGRLKHAYAVEQIKKARFLVMPSLWYETFGRTIAEAYACHRPVVASRLGAMAELVDDGSTGLLFEPGNADDLASKVRFLIENPRECERMGEEARADFEENYTAEANYHKLVEIYERAMENARASGRIHRRPSERFPAACSGDRPPKLNIAGTKVSRVSCESATERVGAWAAGHESRYICVSPARGVVTAWYDREFRRVLNSADIVTPDGVPVVWSMRLLGARGQQRVYGPDLMLRVCRLCADKGWPVFLYGSTRDVIEKLEADLSKRLPALRVAGSCAPPFRPLREDEDRQMVDRINSSGARVVFVGLGMPKQDRWMHEHVGRVRAVMIGVGAAFDFHAGTLRQAPSWMQRTGLEWLFRLIVEPRRLWRRYLRVVPTFTALAVLQVLGFLKTLPGED